MRISGAWKEFRVSALDGLTSLRFVSSSLRCASLRFATLPIVPCSSCQVVHYYYSCKPSRGRGQRTAGGQIAPAAEGSPGFSVTCLLGPVVGAKLLHTKKPGTALWRGGLCWLYRPRGPGRAVGASREGWTVRGPVIGRGRKAKRPDVRGGYAACNTQSQRNTK